MIGRQPTIAEAVENILRPSNPVEFQIRSIEFYRENFGDEFADTVRQRARAVLIARKKQNKGSI